MSQSVLLYEKEKDRETERQRQRLLYKQTHIYKLWDNKKGLGDWDTEGDGERKNQIVKETEKERYAAVLYNKSMLRGFAPERE
jgi:hypothetical protein